MTQRCQQILCAPSSASLKCLSISPKLAQAARAIAADSAAKGLPKSGDSAKDEEKKDTPKAPGPAERIKEAGYRFMRFDFHTSTNEASMNFIGPFLGISTEF